MSLLTLKDTSFSYDTQTIFKDISLTTTSGEIFCLMGKNGCGKTTLLDCILGVHPLEKGSIAIAEQPLKSYTPRNLAKHMAYLPQSYDRSFPYTTNQVILMGRTAYMSHFGSPSAADTAIVQKLLTEIGIDHLAERPYTKLSGGELQLVLLARALAQESPLILMDEPTAHLDYYNELLFLETIAKLVKSGNRTIFMATHSPNQAFYLEAKDIPIRVGLMSRGRIIEIGKPKDVLTSENLQVVYNIQAEVIKSQGMRQVFALKTLKGEK